MKIRGVDIVRTDRGSGLPVLWCHGMTGSQALDGETGPIDWDRIAQSNRVIRWDSRGHGQSGFTTRAQDFAWPSLALDALAIAAESGLDQFVLGGGSMGCGAAVHAALLAPEKVKALLLVVPPTAWETRQATREAYPKTAELLEQKGLPALLDSWLPPTTFWGIYTEAAYKRHLEKLNPQALALIFRGAALSDLPPRQAVAAIRVPTLILAMDDDPGHPVSTAQGLHEQIPGSRLEVAHSVSQVLGWTDRVLGFLKSIDEPRHTGTRQIMP